MNNKDVTLVKLNKANFILLLTIQSYCLHYVIRVLFNIYLNKLNLKTFRK